jgi:hypothetical protein
MGTVSDYRHLYIAKIIKTELFYGGSEALDEETVATMRRVCDDVLRHQIIALE